ncbi:unnamed protein product [Bemisia tabaci]|uniref:Protein takeout n=1 Tax=Bemisia tabaci TaxID=7038 RepID=A0A9P0A9M3_BEMTA|nr:PREDICTED: protein takeout-like [Bemisia tabaci]CAH0388544.1 unnamed protein product [Bemisia tabaci]
MLPVRSSILFLCCAVISQVASAPNSPPAKLPKTFKRCKKLDPNLPDCLRTAVQGVIPEFVKGVPSLGVLPLDPLELKTLVIEQGDGPVSIKLDFKDLFIHGIASAVITSVTSNLKNYTINLTAELKKPIILDGMYNVHGKVLILPITGTGKCKLVLEGFRAKIGIKGKAITKNGIKYMEVQTFKFGLSTTKLRVKLENLFNGDKALGDNMNVFLNENWEDILKELQPGFEDSLSQAFLEISNRVFTKVPFDQIFLD